jgi:tyrosyl-tRNA synthetase
VEDLNFVHQSQDLLTGQKGNFQETVSASPIIQKENHMLGIDLADHIKEETQIQKAVHVGNLTDLRENFQETVSASPTIQKENHMLGIDLTELFK